MLVHGEGLLNSAIDKLPIELHIPGYQYCGPGTQLAKRLARGDPGINPLDSACKEHDISYSRSADLNIRHQADKVLEHKAWKRVKSKDATFGEKAAAWAVTNAMKAKRKFGMGHGNLFRNAVRSAGKTIKRYKVKDTKKAINIALKAAKKYVRDAGRKPKITARIIPVPKTGGILPFLIPLFAGLSASGALAGGAAGIAKAVNAAADAKKQLAESQRHNRMMEAVALGKRGEGLYLKPYRAGLGLYLSPKNCREGR